MAWTNHHDTEDEPASSLAARPHRVTASTSASRSVIVDRANCGIWTVNSEKARFGQVVMSQN
nr:hypothetical protein JVH1_9123 [Rhodococcus sp. JVH1]